MSDILLFPVLAHDLILWWHPVRARGATA